MIQYQCTIYLWYLNSHSWNKKINIKNLYDWINLYFLKYKFKDDFQFVLRSLRTLMFINIINGSLDGMRIDVITYLISKSFQILFPTASLIFTAVKLSHEVIWERTKY